MSQKDANINKKIEKLQTQIDWFYGEDFKLDQAEGQYQTAIKLAKEIEKDLTDLKNKITVLEKDFSEK